MQPESSLVYKKTEEGDLQIHIFNPPDHDERSPRPAIVFFHGGGALNAGTRCALERALDRQVCVPSEPQYVVAIGAALSAPRG